MADRRHRKALGRAAQDLHRVIRRLGGHPDVASLKAAAAVMSAGGLDVWAAKLEIVRFVPRTRAAGVLSIVNLHAAKEGLDPFGGMRKDPTD